MYEVIYQVPPSYNPRKEYRWKFVLTDGLRENDTFEKWHIRNGKVVNTLIEFKEK